MENRSEESRQDVGVEHTSSSSDELNRPAAAGGVATAQAQVRTPKESGDSREQEPSRSLARPRRRALDLAGHTIEQNLWILAGPLIAERLLQSTVDAADMAMVGRVGAAAVAAVGLSNQISMIATGFFDAIRVGTTSVIARRVGAGRLDEAQKTLRQSLLIAACLGFVSFLMFSVFSAASLRMMGAEPDVIAMGVRYFFWKGLSLCFEYVTMTFAAGLRGSGHTDLPMYVGMVVNLLNLCGNYVLINGRYGFPRLEAEGAGLSTAFARFVGMVLIIYLISNKHNPLKGWFRGSFKPDSEALGRVLQIGLPASGERLTLRGAQILYTRAIAGLGTNAYAAHQIALRIESISLTIGFSFGAATTTLVGQYLGFGDQEKAELAARKAQKIASLAMGCAGVGLFLGAPGLVRLFIPDNTAVTQMGSTVLRIVAIAQPFMAINHVLAGGLRGAGDTKWVMYITGGSAWAVRVALTYLFVETFGLGLPGAWYAMVTDLIARSMMFRWRFGTGHWKHIRV
ncbi:MAG TPA: MATE family efflux transporter [Firmicutes bacterium]|nr:MATE family efflux transporter [Candidatus Fermentithermobacillaceae bacterium]